MVERKKTKSFPDSWRFIAVSKMKFITLFPAEGDINDVLIKTLAEAHANTNIKLEVVHEMFRKPQVGSVRPLCLDPARISHWKTKF